MRIFLRKWSREKIRREENVFLESDQALSQANSLEIRTEFRNFRYSTKLSFFFVCFRFGSPSISGDWFEHTRTWTFANHFCSHPSSVESIDDERIPIEWTLDIRKMIENNFDFRWETAAANDGRLIDAIIQMNKMWVKMSSQQNVFVWEKARERQTWILERKQKRQ